jgi:glycosyltransferase involved in cell wall biosynthesis
VSLSVSVVIPTYQRAHLLPRAIDSALAQVRAGDEIIVVDDGSTDATPSVVAAYGDRVRYLRTANGGPGAARNRGIEIATRDLVAFLDSDDEWMLGKLELARRWLAARPDVLFVFSEFAVTDDAGRPRRRHLIHWHQDSRSWDEILGPGVAYASVAALPEGVADFRVHVGSLYEREFVRGYVLTSSFVVRRVAAGDALRFGEDVMALEDLECFGRVSARGPAAFFDVETAWQHGHVGHRLSLGLDSLRRAQTNILVLERVWGNNPAFLATHGDAYRRVLDELELTCASDLIVLGRMREARASLARMRTPPLSHRLLSRLPGPLVRGGLALRKRLLGRG